MPREQTKFSELMKELEDAIRHMEDEEMIEFFNESLGTHLEIGDIDFDRVKS